MCALHAADRDWSILATSCTSPSALLHFRLIRTGLDFLKLPMPASSLGAFATGSRIFPGCHSHAHTKTLPFPPQPHDGLPANAAGQIPTSAKEGCGIIWLCLQKKLPRGYAEFHQSIHDTLGDASVGSYALPTYQC